MRVVAMISGGKDSCYNMMQCVAEGHDIVALANLHPKDRDELDSFMYQTVGHMGIETLAKAMALPLYRRKTKGLSTQRGKQYTPTDNDEVEDLYSLLALCKEEMQIEAVAVGAILSDYQRVRVENVCSRLNLVSLAYLWRRDQTELLQEMIDCQVHAILIKVASLGLVPDRHLGKSLREIHPYLLKMHNKYGLNVCGEGGEYETFTLDCPLFKQRIVIEDMQIVISSADPICPVGYINFLKLSLETKEIQQSCDVIVKKSLDYLSDLNESTYSDLSDPDLSETELELIEKETRIRESLSQNELMSRSNSLGRHLTTASSSSPIPMVTKSASVDEHTPSTLLSSSTALYTASSLHTSRLASPRFLGSSTTAICGSLSLAVSSLGITGNCGSNTAVASGSATAAGNAGNAGRGDAISTTCLAAIDPTSSLISFTQPPSPFKYERESRPLNNQPMVAINQQGWMWVAGIQGCAPNLEEGLQNALETLRLLALEHKYEMVNYCYITLYMRSIAEFAKMNHIYGQMMNFPQPPTRVCVECPLPENYHVIIEAIAYKAPKRSRTITAAAPIDNESANEEITIAANSTVNNVETQLNKRHTMHVQSISHWAPANIGPYSQSTKINEITYISGQIALVPGSMTVIDGGIRPQCKLTLRHLARIAKSMNAQGQLRDVVHGICFVVHPAYIAEARRQWERRTTNAIMDYIVVPALPREALVEWQVWAHTHNDRFEYEETGCSVGNYTISIRRRWNYENNCAAIVCYVTTGLVFSATQLSQPNEDLLNNHISLAKNLTAEHLTDIFHYVINRLLKGYPLGKSQETMSSSSSSTPVPTSNCSFTNEQSSSRLSSSSSSSAIATATTGSTLIPAISLKIFYQVTAAPSIELLLANLDELRHKYRDTVSIVFTVLPACSLHNFSTFLSICGVRHE